jgi:Fe-S oxidoreductase/nitrate reductase gamma subunit
MIKSSREIYWNMGPHVPFAMYLLAIAAVVTCAWGFYRRILVYRLGKPLDRFYLLPFRIGRLMSQALSQVNVARGSFAGKLHALFFLGFFLLFIGSLLIMLQADFTEPLFHLRFLQGWFYRCYSLFLDLAGGLAVVGLVALQVRRAITKPGGLETDGEDVLVIFLLLSILISGFFVEGLRMAVSEITANPELAAFSPIGLGIGRLSIAVSQDRLYALHRVFWWFHFLLAIAIIALIPFCNLRHLFTIPANYLFSYLGPKGAIETINLEDERITQFGAASVTDLAWKDILDADACIACERCQNRCPAWETGKPLSPMKIVQNIGEAAFAGSMTPLVESVGPDALWACTTCRACEEVCPAEVEHTNKIIEMRRNLVLMEAKLPGEEVQAAFENLEVNANPFGLAYSGRGAWAEGLDLQTMTGDCDTDILYFAGCYASFDGRNRKVARDFVTICNAAGVKVGILGKDEKCCGEPARKLGNEHLYQVHARQNIEAIRNCGVKRIVTTCPHCFNTLGRDYRELGLDVPVEHYTTFINDLLRQDRLVLAPALFQFTYHDSCYLGRYMGIVDQPRQILKSAGGELIEMARSRCDSFCCGGGGGRILAEESSGSRINELRVRMARETGAPLLVANCPFCLTMFEDAIKSGGLEGGLAVRDLAELVAARIRR